MTTQRMPTIPLSWGVQPVDRGLKVWLPGRGSETYDVEYRNADDGSDWIQVTAQSPAAGFINIIGLLNGANYDVRVRVGNTPWSTERRVVIGVPVLPAVTPEVDTEQRVVRDNQSFTQLARGLAPSISPPSGIHVGEIVKLVFVRQEDPGVYQEGQTYEVRLLTPGYTGTAVVLANDPVALPVYAGTTRLPVCKEVGDFVAVYRSGPNNWRILNGFNDINQLYQGVLHVVRWTGKPWGGSGTSNYIVDYPFLLDHTTVETTRRCVLITLDPDIIMDYEVGDYILCFFIFAVPENVAESDPIMPDEPLLTFYSFIEYYNLSLRDRERIARDTKITDLERRVSALEMA